jgi:hypothetical protein
MQCAIVVSQAASTVILPSADKTFRRLDDRMTLGRRDRLHKTCAAPKIEPGAQSFQIKPIGALAFWWRMIFSENRTPLFRIML